MLCAPKPSRLGAALIVLTWPAALALSFLLIYELRDNVDPLLIICELSGVVLLCGSLYLLKERVIYLDSTTKQPTEVKLPLLGSIKTQTPVLALVFIAAVLVLVPLARSRELQHRRLTGHIQGSAPDLSAHVLVIPNYNLVVNSRGDIDQRIPVLPESYTTYKVVVIAYGASHVLDMKPDPAGGFRMDPPLDLSNEKTAQQFVVATGALK